MARKPVRRAAATMAYVVEPCELPNRRLVTVTESDFDDATKSGVQLVASGDLVRFIPSTWDAEFVAGVVVPELTRQGAAVVRVVARDGTQLAVPEPESLPEGSEMPDAELWDAVNEVVAGLPDNVDRAAVGEIVENLLLGAGAL